jgi:electron transfer flavoprotein alpha subunit
MPGEGVLIGDEVQQGKLSLTTKELLAAGRKLADELGQPLAALLIGEVDEAAAREAVSLGADRVYTAGAPRFFETPPDSYVEIFSAVQNQSGARIILLPHTDLGWEVAPRLGARLDGSVCLNCVGLDFDQESGAVLLTRPVYGGNAMAVWASAADQVQVVTVKPRSFSPPEADTSRAGEVIALSVSVDEAAVRAKLEESAREEVKGVKLEDARVVVAGGGGIGGPEGFKLLEELARLLGGALGATRVACDERWVPLSLEIGQTGRTVAPELYIAVGISGAVQHMAGCAGSKCIVAINRDPEAHIFKEADFGVVGDYREVVPALIESLKSLLSQ